MQTRHLSQLSKFKSKQKSIIPLIDRWQLSNTRINPEASVRMAAASAFTQHIIGGDAQSAWSQIERGIEEDPHFLANFSPKSCSKFFLSLSNDPLDPRYHWHQAEQVFEGMKRVELDLSPADYICLLKLALEARDYFAIQRLWHEIENTRPEILNRVGLWNAYIQASCQAYTPFWPLNSLAVEAKKVLPLVDLNTVMRKMDIAGVTSNSRTYELIILALARQGNLATVRNVLKHAWLSESHPKHSIMYPTTGTIAAIIEAFAFNGKLLEGLQLVSAIQKRYKVSLSGATSTWYRLWKLASEDTTDKHLESCELTENLWAATTAKNSPTWGMWDSRITYLRDKKEYDLLAKLVPQLIEINDGRPLAEDALKSCAVGYVESGRALEALELIEEWAGKGLDIRVSIEEFVRKKAGLTSYQLKMFKEDDDEDWW